MPAPVTINHSVSLSLVPSLPHACTFVHTFTITCSCCYGAPDQDFSCSFSVSYQHIIQTQDLFSDYQTVNTNQGYVRLHVPSCTHSFSLSHCLVLSRSHIRLLCFAPTVSCSRCGLFYLTLSPSEKKPEAGIITGGKQRRDQTAERERVCVKRYI